MKHYFLGEAANYTRKARLEHTFIIGSKKDSSELTTYLANRYDSTEEKVALTKNGRSALALAILSTVPKRSKIIINAFTCHAVIEAIRAADCIPVYADINEENLNFTVGTIKKVYDKSVSAIIIQNTLANPTDIKPIEEFAKNNNIKIIEDLAHCTGMRYKDGREAGTIGAATALSFGKDKSIDTISGGAAIIREDTPLISRPTKSQRFIDIFRARFYPLFGAIYRALAHVRLSTPWMWILLKLHLVERSADNKLDITRKLANFEAKLALKQLKSLPRDGIKPIRTFMLIKNRDKILEELNANGFHFNGFWYEKPVSPARYYDKLHFKENEYEVAVKVSKEIINLPNYYRKKDLKKAYDIIEKGSKNELD